MRLIDMVGQRSGRLLVLSKDQRPKMWLCRCECGNTCLVTGSNLRKGNDGKGTRSCGCLATEWSSHLGSNPTFVAKRAAKTVKHGHKRRGRMSPEYRTWIGMKRRCYDARFKDYPRWGGRGITVCERWRDSFEAFLADMGPRPSSQHSIDRRDSTIGYSPENCRWATPQEQGGNKVTNIGVTVDGVAFESLSAVCRHFGVVITTAHLRIKAGVDPAVAVSLAGRLHRPRTRESYLRKDRRPA